MNQKRVEANLVLDFSQLTSINSGADSDVFRDGNQVIKRYYPWIPIDLIKEYQDLTKRAVELLSAHPRQVVARIGSKKIHFNYRINPIEEVGQLSSGEAVAVSKYIPGLTVLNLVSQMAGSEVNRLIRELPDQAEKEFLLGIITKELRPGKWRRLWLRDNPRMQNQANNLGSLSTYLSQELGAKGLIVNPLNVKARIRPSLDSGDFVITDLYSVVSQLRRQPIK